MTLILSGTDGLSDVDGSAATPAVRGTDTNTGIFFPAADTIAFAEGGAEVARITNTGAWSFGASGTNTGTSGQVLTSAGSGAAPTWAAAGGGFSSAQVFTSSSTFTVPSSGRFKVTLVGGGGGGSGNNGVSCNGGGGGGTAIKWYSGITPGTVCTVTIGAAGPGGTLNNPGTNGGNSSFTGTGVTTLTANGGSGAGNQQNTPTSGGTATGGDINISGGSGSAYQSVNANGGSNILGGTGGGSLLGLGGGAATRDSRGADGSGYGAGGGGGGGREQFASGLPGNGTAGICVVEF